MIKWHARRCDRESVSAKSLTRAHVSLGTSKRAVYELHTVTLFNKQYEPAHGFQRDVKKSIGLLKELIRTWALRSPLVR